MGRRDAKRVLEPGVHARRLAGIAPLGGWVDRGRERWGVTAASFPIVARAITYDDLKAAQINHALALVYPNVRRRAFVSPARRDDGGRPIRTRCPKARACG